jgi:hypothetical protein
VRGNELLLKCDGGLEFGEVPDLTIRPERAILTGDGLDERLGMFPSTQDHVQADRRHLPTFEE